MARSEQGNGLEMRGDRDKLTDNGKAEQEVKGSPVIDGEKQVDRYGFTGGAQQAPGDL